MKTTTNLKAGVDLMGVHNAVCGAVSDYIGDYYWDAVDLVNAIKR